MPVVGGGPSVMVGGTLGGVVVQVKLVLADNTLSFTVTVTALLAAAVELTVPEIRPVEALIVNPAGRPLAL